MTRFPAHRHYQYLANAATYMKVRANVFLSQYVNSLQWSPSLDDLHSETTKRVFLEMLKSYDHESETLEDWNPWALAAKVNDADTPNWHEAMSGPNAEGFKQACLEEIRVLERMEVWDVVERQPWMSVLPGTWAFRIKRYPDGLVRKLKARFCARGDRQTKGIDFF